MSWETIYVPWDADGYTVEQWVGPEADAYTEYQPVQDTAGGTDIELDLPPGRWRVTYRLTGRGHKCTTFGIVK